MASLSSDKTIHTSLLLISAWIWLSSVSSLAELQHFQHPVKPDGSLNILVVGDWGRKGRYNQSEVAFQMGSVGQKLDIDFVISTGDNFYEDGLTGVDDPAFNESFTAIYTAPSLNKQWYNVLGNHDYRGDVEAQLSHILRQKDKRWLCLRSYTLKAEFVEFFFVDTTPFVDKYFTHPGDDTYDWKGVYPREYYLSNLLKDMDEALKKSNAQWKIVVGHHTIKSAGNHGVTEELVEQLVPILEANTVDMYINGHDHCLEHIIESNSQIQYLTTGGGSKAWKGQIHPWDPEELKFYYDGQGFMSMQITQKSVYIAFYDIFGRVLHAWNISKEQYSSA
ncbi:purple acid phosphatase 7-like isoform X1 [Durio zibethinus]|uniref:Purple acid phosphatase n=1 Tax=Durio zibethinus TaxID=66656 RepID=A0A6P6BF73_DURZI|nr:purple acid phosphatase 7-like isoform X1 [Durio zibethinus]